MTWHDEVDEPNDTNTVSIQKLHLYALHARIAELEQDKARLDGLERLLGTYRIYHYLGEVELLHYADWRGDWTSVSAPSLRAGIDAAMAMEAKP